MSDDLDTEDYSRYDLDEIIMALEPIMIILLGPLNAAQREYVCNHWGDPEWAFA